LALKLQELFYNHAAQIGYERRVSVQFARWSSCSHLDILALIMPLFVQLNSVTTQAKGIKAMNLFLGGRVSNPPPPNTIPNTSRTMGNKRQMEEKKEEAAKEK
jgi:hypothetical protein